MRARRTDRAVAPLARMLLMQALQLFEDVGGKRFVGIHWGTFDLAEEPIEEPPRRLEAAARRRGLDPERIWLLKHGETRPW